MSAVNRRKLERWLGLVLILVTPGMCAGTKAVPKTPIVMMISVQDDVGIPWKTIRASERQASHVFREAGIELDWQNCHALPETSGETQAWQNCAEAVFPGHLHLRIVNRSIGLSPDVMGISFLSADGSGYKADVFYDEIKCLQKETNASLPTLLGHVTAHEIGHLLLGANSHAPQGIMRAVWGPDELKSAKRGALFFSAEQSQHMRDRVASAIGALCSGMERGEKCATTLN